MSDNYFKNRFRKFKENRWTAGSTSSKISVILLLIWPAISLNLLWPDLRTSRAQSAGTRTADAVQPLTAGGCEAAAGTYQRQRLHVGIKKKNYRSISALHTLRVSLKSSMLLPWPDRVSGK